MISSLTIIALATVANVITAIWLAKERGEARREIAIATSVSRMAELAIDKATAAIDEHVRAALACEATERILRDVLVCPDCAEGDDVDVDEEQDWRDVS